jgi:isopropylmalate/homocitrate/citramalate synthase
MRQRYIQEPGTGKLIKAEDWAQHQYEKQHGPMVMGDIQPYKSMVTGEMITSRSQHREHLKKHGLREIGNDVQPLFDAYKNLPDVAPQQRKEIIRAQVDAMTEKQFRAAIKKDIDFVKWNSRER